MRKRQRAARWPGGSVESPGGINRANPGLFGFEREGSRRGGGLSAALAAVAVLVLGGCVSGGSGPGAEGGDARYALGHSGRPEAFRSSHAGVYLGLVTLVTLHTRLSGQLPQSIAEMESLLGGDGALDVFEHPRLRPVGASEGDRGRIFSFDGIRESRAKRFQAAVAEAVASYNERIAPASQTLTPVVRIRSTRQYGQFYTMEITFIPGVSEVVPATGQPGEA